MKPVILIFTSYYLPGYRAGGPIRTIANMVERLSDTFEFRIIALDRDFGDVRPYPDFRPNTWTPRGSALVQHVSPDHFGMRKVAEILRSTPHDAIYLNSFFDRRFTQQVLINRAFWRLTGRPVVLAPRGEFSKGALQLKHFKKSAFIRLATWLKLYEGVTWQASSALEAADIERVMRVEKRKAGRVVASGHVAAAPDLADRGNNPDSAVEAGPGHSLDGPLRACFLSRISPKKNLDYALRVLAEVRVQVRFAIYGPIEDTAYWTKCKALISKLPSNIRVVYEGEIVPELVVSTLMQNDLFLFPTRGENFGHVIHEALRAGLPLLISDQTPWQGLEEQGVGWDLPLHDMSAFARRIEEIAGWSNTEHRQWAARASALANRVGGDPATLEANRRLFLDAINECQTSE